MIGCAWCGGITWFDHSFCTRACEDAWARKEIRCAKREAQAIKRAMLVRVALSMGAR